MDKKIVSGHRGGTKESNALLRIGLIAAALFIVLQGCVFWVDDDGYRHHRGYDGHHRGWYEHSSGQPNSSGKQETASSKEKGYAMD